MNSLLFLSQPQKDAIQRLKLKYGAIGFGIAAFAFWLI